jgi:hypothetical protein
MRKSPKRPNLEEVHHGLEAHTGDGSMTLRVRFISQRLIFVKMCRRFPKSD